jgi:hypothetical protein
MNTNNSISSTVKKLLEINTNSLKTFERINEAITTQEKNVPLEILNGEGGTTTVYVPSFGYMKRELERLDANVKALSGLGKGNTKVRLSDGSYQNVITSKLKSPAKDITSFVRPSEFNVKSNYFFEDFMNPLLTVSFNVTNQIPSNTERVLVKRILFDNTNQAAVDYFVENFLDREDISYDQALRNIVNNNISHQIDEEIRDMPFQNVQYFGSFDVLAINDSKKEVTVDGQTKRKAVKRYRFDKLTYSDSNKDVKETEVIKAGDEFIVNTGNFTTKYRATRVDNSTREVELELVEGFEAIRIGANALKIYKNTNIQLNVDINVGFNERLLVFVKAIDPDSKILAENWSPGVGFYSNDLIRLDADGNEITLADYYKAEVADFGKFIKALKEDSIPPATEGITPDAPVLDGANFKVVQINRHLTDNDAANKIKQLTKDKVTVEESVKKLDDTIVKKRSEVATKKYSSQIEADKDKNQLNSLIEQRAAETKLYGSIVNQIQSLSSDTNISNVTPKYRIRGFWSVPTAKQVASTANQEVVQFIIQYRYLSTSGKAPEVSQIAFTEDTREKTAVFSNWNEVKTPPRERAKDPVTGKFTWKDSLIEDGQSVNFNQLDIPIQQGEVVEFRIKSVSEAGYPANPIMSGWSEPITVSFPEAELDTADLQNIIEQNATEIARVKLNEELNSAGIYTHVGDSFTSNENYYAHVATNIASGFLSAEQKPISVYDKIAELQRTIEALQQKIDNTAGELFVKLIAEDGTVTVISKNTTNKVFAGYYVDEVAELSVKKGHIVTKTFKLLLENTKATELELISRIAGERIKPAYRSSASGSSIGINGFGVITNDQGVNNVDDKIISDAYYTGQGKYDVAPIQYQNLTANELSIYEDLQPAPYQSAQRRGQFIYSRFMDIANINPLYVTSDIATTTGTPNNLALTSYEYVLGYGGFEANNAVSFSADGDASGSEYIWAGSFGKYWNDNLSVPGTNVDLTALGAFAPEVIDTTSTITSTDYNTGIFLHKDHPDLETFYNSTYPASVADMSDVTSAEQNSILQSIVDSGIYTMPITATIPNSLASISLGLNNHSTKQLGFRDTGSMISADQRTFKMSFDANDQYLLGGRSCGSFLFMSPINLSSLTIDGDNKLARKKINVGSNNSISVDIVFQYRMTDYAGNDPATDVGNIGGLTGISRTSLTYSKKIGLDIFDKYDDQFSFDLEVYARYAPKGSNINSIKAAQLVANTNIGNGSAVSSPISPIGFTNVDGELGPLV